MCDGTEFEDIFIKQKLPYNKCVLLPEPFDRYVLNYKKWEEYAKKQSPPGKGLLVCASIKTFLTEDGSYLERALDLVEFSEPKDRALAIGLAGMVFSYIGQKAKGIQMLRDAMQIHSSSKIIINLAIELNKDGVLDESAELCKSVLKDEPDNIRALRTLSINYLDRDDVKKARESISHALYIDPKNKSLREVSGDIFLEEENYTLAIKEYKRAKTFLRFKPYISYRLAICYYYLEKFKESKKLVLKIRDAVFQDNPYFRDNSVEIKKMISQIISK